MIMSTIDTSIYKIFKVIFLCAKIFKIFYILTIKKMDTISD